MDDVAFPAVDVEGVTVHQGGDMASDGAEAPVQGLADLVGGGRLAKPGTEFYRGLMQDDARDLADFAFGVTAQLPLLVRVFVGQDHRFFVSIADGGVEEEQRIRKGERSVAGEQRVEHGLRDIAILGLKSL
jgi:hypothetical protein